MANSIHESSRQGLSEGATGENTIGFRERNVGRKGLDIDEAYISTDNTPLVPPGDYQLAFVDYRTALCYGRVPKVALRFRVVTLGEYFETELDRWYNCKRLIGKPCKGGGFEAGRHSNFLREYMTLFTDAVNRRDRVSFKPFRQNLITGRVVTVDKDSKQRPLPLPLQYSIIRVLLKAGA